MDEQKDIELEDELDEDTPEVEDAVEDEDEPDTEEDIKYETDEDGNVIIPDDDDEEDDDDFFCDGECEGCSGCDDEEFFEIVCPSCGETVCFDQELDPETLICPACGEKFGCIVDEDDFNELNEK